MRGEAGRRGWTASWMVLQGPVGPQGPLPLTPISLVLLRRAGHEARGLGLKAILLPPSRADQAPWEQDVVAPRASISHMRPALAHVPGSRLSATALPER